MVSPGGIFAASLKWSLWWFREPILGHWAAEQRWNQESSSVSALWIQSYIFWFGILTLGEALGLFPSWCESHPILSRQRKGYHLGVWDSSKWLEWALIRSLLLLIRVWEGMWKGGRATWAKLTSFPGNQTVFLPHSCSPLCCFHLQLKVTGSGVAEEG